MAQLPPDLQEKLSSLKTTAEAKKVREGQAIQNNEQRSQAIQQAMQKDTLDRTNAERALVVEADLQVLRPIYENMPDGDPRSAALLDLMQRWTTDAMALAEASDDPNVVA